MEDEIKKIYKDLYSKRSVTVGYDEFAKAYNNNPEYRAKIDAAAGVKKKEPSKASDSQPSAKPSASATSGNGIPPIQRREPIQPTFVTQAPNIFGDGRPVAPRPTPTKAADQLSPAAKARIQQQVAQGLVEEAPAKKPEMPTEPSIPRPSSYLSFYEKEEFERADRVREAVYEAESELRDRKVNKNLFESFNVGFLPTQYVKGEYKIEDSEQVQDARKNANDVIRQTFGVDFDVYVPNENGVLVEDQERIGVVKNYLDKTSQYEQYTNAQNTINEARRREQEDPNAFPLTSQLLNTVPESLGLASAFAFDAMGIGDTKAYSDEVRIKRMARRVALGIEDGKGITQNISEGNIGDAMKELMLAGADFVPQMAAFVINPLVGYAYNAASAGGSTYDQFRDRNDLSKGDKMTLALTSAAADFVLNKLTMGAEKSIRASLGIAADELGTEVAKKKALDYLNPLKNEVFTKGFLGEAAEEGGVNLINQIAASVIAGDDFDMNSLIDEALIGGVFGSAAVGVPKVLARGANGLANASMVSEFRKVTNEIKKINDALLNEKLTPAESALLTKDLERLSARQNEISNESEQLYAAMTKEDQDALYETHRQINEGLKTYNESDNDVVKKAAFKQVRDALIAKRDLENKYVGQVKTERDDSEKEAGVPSPVVEGEAVVETQPVEGAGQETPKAGGVLQVPVEKKVADIEKAQRQLDNVESTLNPKAKHPIFNVGQKHESGNKYNVRDFKDERKDTTQEGVEVITRIWKPAEVDADGKLTKTAEVEVTIFDSYEQAQEFVNAQYSKYKALAEGKLAKAKTELAALEQPPAVEEAPVEAPTGPALQAEIDKIEARRQEATKEENIIFLTGDRVPALTTTVSGVNAAYTIDPFLLFEIPEISNIWGATPQEVIDKINAKYDEEIAALKKPVQQTGEVKEGVSEIFESNPELSSIGTPQQYSAYLATIFPDSQVKDIVYHGTNSKFDKFSFDFLGGNTGNKFKSIFLTPDIELANAYGSNTISALVNIIGVESLDAIKNEFLKDSKIAQSNIEELNRLTIDEIEDFLMSEYNDTNKRLEDYLKETGVTGKQLENKVVQVFDPEQIHILGSEQDIEGFKNFVGKAALERANATPTVEAETKAPIEATVFAAPFYDTKVNNIEEARDIRQSEPYVKNLDVIRNTSALFNVEIDEVDESIGGFVNNDGDKIVEVSNIIRVKGTPEDIENYAAFLATSAPETQEATIAATYVEPDSETHNIDELTISVSDIDGAIEALKENDIYDFTINDSNNTITFLDFSKGGDDAFAEKIGNFTNSLDSKNISYERKDIRAIDSKYIGPSERAGILGRLQEALVQQGQTGTELYQQVQQAIDRNNKFLEKTKKVAEEKVETPASDTKSTKAVKPDTGKSLDDVYNSYKESIKPRISPKTILEGAKKQLIDRQSKIKNAVLSLGLRNAYDRIVNKSGASARANDKYRRAEKKIYSGLSEKDIETLDKIIFARRVIQIDENFDQRGQQRPKHPLGYKSENANFELAELKNKLGEEKYNDLIKRSDAYFEEFRSILKDLYDAGLVSEEMYNDLRTNNYQPRKFIEHVYDFENSEFLIRDSGLSQQQIKAIKEGSEKDLIMSSRFLLGSYLLSSSKRIFTNRANTAVAEAIGKDGSNDWVRSLDEKTDPDPGFTRVYYFEDGVQKQFQLRSDLKKELDNVSSLAGTDGKVGRFFSMLSGTPAVKLMATRANPLFAFKNFPRDLGHILFFTNVYDKHNLYYATYLIFGDFIKGLKSSIQDTQDFREYMDLGGGMDFISIQGRDGNFVSRSAINKTVEGIGKLGEWSEVGFRIGVYRRFKDDGIAEFEKKNGVKPEGEDLLQIKERAVAKAREIIDFSQGGEAVKAADKFVPYLNAAFQGFRVGATYVANNPKKFASKFVQAQMGLLALSFFNALISDDEDMEAIPEHTRLMNFIIMLPWTRVDEEGKKRRAYIQIPKTQQAAPFFALMDVANRKIINEVFGKEYSISKDEYAYIINGARKGLPIGDDDAITELTSMVPIFNAAFTYKSNYDSFRDRMITMEMGKVLPAYEGVNDPNVEQFYKVIGEVTGMSPIRGKVAVEKLITSPNSSFIVGMSYGLLDAVAKNYPLDKGEYNIELAEKEKKNFLKQFGLNMSKAFVRETDPDWKLYNQKETLDNIDMEAGTERARLRKKAKELAVGTNTQENLDKAVVEAQKIIDEIAKKNPIDAMYFMDSFKANIGQSSASQEAVEIQYSATDKARAEKIKYLYNPQTQDDFLNLMKDVYQQTGYKISQKTIYEYQNLYGKLK